MGQKVIIDCDVGVDDALALILAFQSPEIEVKAVTGVNGNVSLPLVFENIKKVLSLIQPQEKPFIAAGADQPLRGKSVYAHSVHGEDGLGGARIDLREGEEWWQSYPNRADELLTEMACQFPDELTMVAIGPLTNLALGLQRDPQGMKKFREVVIMGGAVRTKGNITPHAEFNIFSDPLAAKLVFESGLPVTLVPLDVTHQVNLTSQWIEERVKRIKSPFSQFVIEATGYNSATHQFRNKELIHLHDPLAIGVVIDPNLVKTEELSLQVETEEGQYYGKITEVNPASRIKTRGFLGCAIKEDQKIEVCLEVESDRFLELFISRLE